MLRKLRNRAQQAVKGRVEFNLDGFELDISPEEVIADLNFGVGPIADTARLGRKADLRSGGSHEPEGGGSA